LGLSPRHCIRPLFELIRRTTSLFSLEEVHEKTECAEYPGRTIRAKHLTGGLSLAQVRTEQRQASSVKINDTHSAFIHSHPYYAYVSAQKQTKHPAGVYLSIGYALPLIT
jgi:hypothetical protein